MNAVLSLIALNVQRQCGSRTRFCRVTGAGGGGAKPHQEGRPSLWIPRDEPKSMLVYSFLRPLLNRKGYVYTTRCWEPAEEDLQGGALLDTILVTFLIESERLEETTEVTKSNHTP